MYRVTSRVYSDYISRNTRLSSMHNFSTKMWYFIYFYRFLDIIWKIFFFSKIHQLPIILDRRMYRASEIPADPAASLVRMGPRLRISVGDLDSLLRGNTLWSMTPLSSRRQSLDWTHTLLCVWYIEEETIHLFYICRINGNWTF